MPLTEGRRLGHYLIIGPVGAGGMGQVYRARDERLDREVAIKLLNDDYASDPSWLGRFEREARLLASVNHPNIATLHGRDEADGVRFLVMELVPGRTLRDVLLSARLPLAEALGLARQLTLALEAAHERGVIHRDLKPANVMVTPDGHVKVLDFGLAVSAPVLSAPAEVGSGATEAHQQHTAEGVVVGTPAYMSPEQSRGKPIDKRSDIWAFGCVLFEAVAGRPSFGGETYSDTIASILERAPAWDALPATTPRRLVELIQRCLRKDPNRRLRDIGDARIEIEETLAELAAGPAAAPPPPRRGMLLFAVPAVLVAALAFALGWLARPAAVPRKEDPPGWSGEMLIGNTTRAFGPQVSPDGRSLAFIVLQNNQNAQLGVMNTGTGRWRVLTGSQARGGVGNFCWSKDSGYIYYDRFFAAPMGIFRVAVDEPTPTTEESPLFEEAECPQRLPDGSFVVTKIDPQGNLELWRCWPDKQREPSRVLNSPILIGSGVDETWWPRPVRAMHRSNRVIFCGRLKTADEPSPRRRLYVHDLESGGPPRVLLESVAHDLATLCVSPDDRHAYIVQPAGNAFEITRVAVDGDEPPYPVLGGLINPVFGLHVDDQDNFYLDQFARTVELLRFPLLKGAGRPAAERLADLSRGPIMQPVELPDGRLVLPSRTFGRDRLLVALPRKDGVELLPDYETRPPATVVGEDRIAFVQGGERPAVIVAGIERGFPIRHRLTAIPTGPDMTALAASPDGKVIYYIHHKRVYRVPSDGAGKAEALGVGDSVAPFPDGKRLLVQQLHGQGSRLLTFDLASKRETMLTIPGPLRLAPDPIGSRSISRDGRVLVPAVISSNWYWWTAILEVGKDNQATLRHLAVDFDGDIYPSNWDRDGHVLGLGYTTRGDIWRFTRKPAPR